MILKVNYDETRIRYRTTAGKPVILRWGPNIISRDFKYIFIYFMR